ncbi:MAG: hypothetical protein FWF50_06305 [Defluviitaleaceae bacterium]|nr:hypothetical protein [Defluviitaleaceae bacterium]
MRKHKKLFATTFFVAAAAFLAACGTEPAVETPADPMPGEPTITEPGDNNNALSSDARLAELGLDDNLRFVEPRTISVALWDRSHERIPEFNESYWANWVQEQILEEHNIIVEWVPVGRWGENENQSTLLATQTAPDIGYTFDNPMVTTFAGMGGIHNLYPLLQRYGDLLPNLYNLLGDNVYWNLDPQTNELWSITGRLIQDGRVNTFIREDWLNALNLEVPTSLEEFETVLEAFRDNQDIIMPDRTRDLIPFQLQHDVGWSGSLLFESFIPSNITEREWFVHGFDDRRFHFEDAVREGSRVLNRWFNNGLLWNDFILHEPGDSMGDDLIRLGYVGSAILNWDMPFRPADAVMENLHENVGPEANFIAITPFTNDAGQVRKFFPNPTDRFIFFPTTNTEPLASLLYLDWISRLDVIEYLQFGVEGIHRETLANGAIMTIGETDTHSWPDNQFMPSLRNFDITMTINGIYLGNDVLSAQTLALGYPGSEPEAVIAARAAGLENAYWFRNVMTRVRASEEGMSVPLADQRNVLFHNVIANTTPENFDATWTQMYQAYLNLGAAAIIAEREQAWIEQFGDVDRMP